MDNVLAMIGMALRAGRLAVGEEPVGAACRARDCRLLLLAGDAAGNTIRRAEHFAQAGQCVTVTLPHTREELGEAVGRSVCAMAAVTDTGLAGAIARRLAQRDPERYGEAAQRLAIKAQRADQRRQEQRAHDKRLRRGGKTCPGAK